jgi:membrane-bound metal-dependent hydrolase YbcI (DUF457 family)
VPVTPFHFGPGALVSVASPRYVSFLAFCAVNVLIDVESLRNMLTHQARIHTFFHTYLGASLAAFYLVALFIAARWLALRLPDNPFLRWRTLTVLPVAIGSALGAWSHVLLDSVMHADIAPLAPWSRANPLFQIISTTALHVTCLLCGGLAILWFVLRSNYRSEQQRRE